MNNDGEKEKVIADWEARQSPVGFYNLALSYLDTADALTDSILGSNKLPRLELMFDHPVRHLYSHTWELALKACLFAQGIPPRKLKKDFGHNLQKAWRQVEKVHFAILKLTPETEAITNHLGFYHAEKMFAYPLTGVREYLPLNHLKAESQRFRIKRSEIATLFLSDQPR